MVSLGAAATKSCRENTPPDCQIFSSLQLFLCYFRPPPSFAKPSCKSEARPNLVSLFFPICTSESSFAPPLFVTFGIFGIMPTLPVNEDINLGAAPVSLWLNGVPVILPLYLGSQTCVTVIISGSLLHFVISENCRTVSLFQCRALAKRLAIAEKSRETLSEEVRLAGQNITRLQDELATTKRSYEDQLSMMSDHLCSMNETLSKQREEIDTLKLGSKVKIGVDSREANDLIISESFVK